MKKWWSYCIVFQSFTQILCTLISDLIARQIERSECLYEREKTETMHKTRRSDDLTVLCCNPSPKYCAPWSPILLLCRSSVVSVCIKREKTETMHKTRRSDGLTVLCFNPSPKYCAPWAPIPFHNRLSAVSVCMKERRLRPCIKQEEVMVLLYCVSILHPNIVHLDLRFHSTAQRVQWVSVWKRKDWDHA